MTPKKMFYTTLAASTLIISTVVVGVPMYLEHRASASFVVVPALKEYASLAAQVEPMTPKIEILNTSFDQSGGAVQVVARLTYDSGQQDECTFGMVLEPTTGGVNATPQSKVCRSISHSK
jgi:hypothetical protein